MPLHTHIHTHTHTHTTSVSDFFFKVDSLSERERAYCMFTRYVYMWCMCMYS